MLRQIWLLLLCHVFVIDQLHGQSSCLPANAEIVYVCPPNNPSDANFNAGTDTYSGSSYNWYRGSTKVGGPLPGTGNAESISFVVSSQSVAGYYVIERTQPGFPTVCVFNKQVIYSQPIAGLTRNATTANSVSFSWTSQGKYIYEVSTDPFPTGYGTITTGSSATVQNLSGNTLYYIHMSAYGDGNCYTDPGRTISFTTPAGACYAAVPTTTIEGGGNYCNGAIVTLRIRNTRTDYTYQWFRNGTQVHAAPGNGGDLTFQFSYGAALAGNYSVTAVAAGCTGVNYPAVSVAAANTVTGLTIGAATESSVNLNWNSSGTGVLYDYAVTTSTAAPTSWSTTNNLNAIINNLQAGTNYYAHVRTSCSVPVSWVNTAFTTLPFTPANCATPTVVTECSLTTAVLAAGNGSWNFNGNYPVNSVGYNTPGKESVYRFTPVTTAVYYLDIAPREGDAVSYLYKPASDGCTGTGWTGIVNVDRFISGKFAIGLLQAGTPYLFVLDNQGTAPATQTFKICMASLRNDEWYCTNARPMGNYTIPAYSTKEEYLIDEDGGLIASLDFSNTPVNTYGARFSYTRHAGALRRDVIGREMLDRNYYLTADAPTSLPGPVKIKFFFSTTDLQTLINDADDGLADVANIADVNVTQNGTCSGYNTFDSDTAFFFQNGNGAYGNNGVYITANISRYGNYNLHGGNMELGYYLTVGHFEDFSTLPQAKGWKYQQVTGVASSVALVSSMANPGASAYGEPYFFKWNTGNTAASDMRLITPPIQTTGTNSVMIDFSWLNGNNPAYSSGSYLSEGLQIEYSLNGINGWTAVSGGAFTRHDASLPAGTVRWNRKQVILPAAVGNKPFVYLSFRFNRTAAGDNFGLDGISILPAPACSQTISTINILNATTAGINFSWPSVAGATNYEYAVQTFPAIPGYEGTITTSTTGSYPGNYIDIGSTQYIFVRANCASGKGAWHRVKLVIPGACANAPISFTGNDYGSTPTYRWQVNNGSGFVNLTNTGVYAGVTTKTLTLGAVPGTYQGYKYRLSFSYDGGVNYYYDYERTLKVMNTWTGTNNNQWSNPLNWSCNAVPDLYTDVIIPSGTPNAPTITTNTSCHNLFVQPGANITISPSIKLTITGISYN